jgi:hypothetical protein
MAKSSGSYRAASPLLLGTASSYTYEATFGMGSIGMNLQSTRSGIGERSFTLSLLIFLYPYGPIAIVGIQVVIVTAFDVTTTERFCLLR